MKEDLPEKTFIANITSIPVSDVLLKELPDRAVQPPAIDKAGRLYYMDWLRVIAFSILIAFHSAEVFAEWNWWISNRERSDTISYILIFFKQWRMPLLFIISGAAVYLTLRRRHPAKFINDRIMRLLVPLIAGMLVVIPPQIYFIKKLDGYTGSFGEFYQTVAGLQWFPQGGFHWLHLWFLAFIFVFSLVVIPVVQWMKTEKGSQKLEYLISLVKHPPVLFSMMILLEAPYFIINSILPRSDAAHLAMYFPFFLFGVLFSTNISIRRALKKNFSSAFPLAVFTTASLYFFFWIEESSGYEFVSRNLDGPAANALRLLLESANQWFWLITILGGAIRYLNWGSRALTYANQAVYPFYIFHQTVIIIIGYYVIQGPSSIVLKFITIFGCTFLFIFLLYETLLKRTRITRLLFGIKLQQEKNTPVRSASSH